MTDLNLVPSFDDISFNPNDDFSKKDTVDENTHVSAEVHNASFESFNLCPELTRAIANNGFEQPSEVQRRCIPVALIGCDIVCQAKSGMGKTAVFVLSILHSLWQNQLSDEDEEQRKKVRAVVICHTRELAIQIEDEFVRFKHHFRDSEGKEIVKTHVFYGGTPIRNDKEYLRNETPHIVIATPGKLNHLVRNRMLNLDHVKYFVLDECDKILGPDSLDMRADIQSIFYKMPRSKQVMMFSATLSDEIREVCKKFMTDPHEVIIDEGRKLSLHGLQQYLKDLSEEEKKKELIRILDDVKFNHVFVFVSKGSRAKAIHKYLVDENFPASSITGKMPQEQRKKQYRAFKNNDGSSRILVSTDLCARGVDFSNVNLVINFDMPRDAETYLHRIGRAGRFGTRGVSIALISSEEDRRVLEDVKAKFSYEIPEVPAHIPEEIYLGSV